MVIANIIQETLEVPDLPGVAGELLGRDARVAGSIRHFDMMYKAL